jgi:hypothetical protein
MIIPHPDIAFAAPASPNGFLGKLWPLAGQVPRSSRASRKLFHAKSICRNCAPDKGEH